MPPTIQQFRRRFINNNFVDVIAVPPGLDFKREYERERRAELATGSTLTHADIDSEYNADVTPDWVYELFGISRP